MDTEGAVLSMLIPVMVAGRLWFPAASEQWPETVWSLPSLERTTCGSHVTPPESASKPVNVINIFCLRHPYWFAGGPAVAVVAGAVASRLIVTVIEFAPPELEAEHVTSIAAVSLVIDVVPQPALVVTVDSASVTLQSTATSPTYQPLFPSMPTVDDAITGGVVSGMERVTKVPEPPNDSGECPTANVVTIALLFASTRVISFVPSLVTTIVLSSEVTDTPL